MTGAISVPVKVDAPSGSGGKRKIGPSTVVILGGAGDLTRRKLIPALFHLLTDGLIQSDLEVLAVGRADWSDEDFQNEMRKGVAESGEPGSDQLHRWEELAPKLHWVRGDLKDENTFRILGERLEARDQALGAPAGRLFYLAIPPSVYASTIASLAESGIAPRKNNPSEQGWVRVVVEKPFGRSLATAHELNQQVRAAFAEHQVYRIDHYLGKETVQNLLVLRFANSIFEPIWNRNHIHHVQITAAESLGVEHRAGYYEEAGVVRDMFQNHLLQLLALTAMEPPAAFRADAVRDEKTKVLAAVRPFEAGSLVETAVRGQYGPGVIEGSRVPGYREEDNVVAESPTATYAAIRFQVDNWRWQGVPFFLRSGKRLARRVTEIAIQFREPPHLLFPNQRNGALSPNVLTVEIQPEEGLSLCFDIKVPGIGVRTTAARMDFKYDRLFGGNDHSAYETLLLDCLAGDQTLFIRDDTTEAAWWIVDPIIEAWAREAPEGFPNYAAGEWGPKAADELIKRAGGVWRRP
jgi:glucose-6-phosphate 1-dehydrogenase